MLPVTAITGAEALKKENTDVKYKHVKTVLNYRS